MASKEYAGVTFIGKRGMFDSLDDGDLIRVHFDATGKIDNYELALDADAEQTRYLPSDSDRDGSSSLVRGFAVKTDAASGNIIIDTEEELCFKADPSQPVLVFDGRNVNVESFSSIEPGDYLGLCLATSAVSQIVVYK